ncbi:4-phosphoerythronate dehydrogenase [Oceanisphaera sp. W20_SRM_FM3]|uniref:4-phosphoerythronate dehydrogenase n=1 Tax=Oceanisphaera sp. W20_SRM_FM3 TaxID=3240267 RepID=UPI003F9658F5
MKLLADENMPYVQELFGDWAEIITSPGRDMTPEQLIDVDVLLVRSITQVNHALLAKANRLRFVGTATIGCDHIDTELLRERGIAFASAPGCNKVAVGDYVLAALLKVAAHKHWQLKDKTLAVVGVGNTGSQVVQRAKALGMRVLQCDPFKALSCPMTSAINPPTDFVDLGQALTADIVSFHVPITQDGAHPTWHLLGASQISALNADQVLINACRGEVWDNAALLARQLSKEPLTLVMDVWEREPNVLAPLVSHVLLATPHIAGYSLEGKARGTFALYQALAEHAQLVRAHSLEQLLPAPAITRVELAASVAVTQNVSVDQSVYQSVDQALLARLVALVYDIERDDAAFRVALGQPGFFDRLRKLYPERRELASLSVVLGASKRGSAQLQALGFSC